jgi:hypothetical protein
MNAIDAEFSVKAGTKEEFHPACIRGMLLVRDAFLLLSLLRVLHLDQDRLGQLSWATTLPQSLSWISFDYKPLTTARCLNIPQPHRADFQICGECFKLWIRNIRENWNMTCQLVGAAVGCQTGFRADLFRHAVNNLLKHDPCPNPERCCDHPLE